MADPTNVSVITDPNITTALTYLGGFVAAVIAALAVRMGWKSGSQELKAPTDAVEIKGAVFDSSAMKILAASLEGLGFTIMEVKKKTSDEALVLTKQTDKMIESVESVAYELRELNREVRDLAREIAKRS